MINTKQLEELFIQKKCTDFKWMSAKDIIVAHWVRLRCMFGCGSYGKCGTCPPNVPPIEECQKIIAEYTDVAVFHFSKKIINPDDRKQWSKECSHNLLELEKEVFLNGYHKTFLLSFTDCKVCDPCSGDRMNCKYPALARPGADALGVDVFSTVRKIGYEIEVLKNYSETMNRYAFLLVQ